ncbi:MAG: hypothetical protein KDA61_07905 [Planctomycetales bacterium]|nr:hypothetical protein [Planctomycetales bacterium]
MLQNVYKRGSLFRNAPRVLAAVCLAMTGCGDVETTVTVSGSVSHKGTPLSGGSVSFYPTVGRPTSAALGSDGSYEAKLEPGDYQATIAVNVALPAGWKEGDPIPKPQSSVPLQYTSRARTPLTAHIDDGESARVDFDLK